MKKAVNEFYKEMEKSKNNILENFEGAVEKIAKHNKINEEELYNYFAREVKEKIGAN
jgi:hypothetical protein